MLWLVAMLPAVAEVRVEDAHGCLEQDPLDEEVRQLLGDEVIDRVDLVARLYGVDGWQLSLEVYDGGVIIWERAMSVERVDCPYLPALVARSVERGLAALPGWSLDSPPMDRERLELGLMTAWTMPLAIRGNFGPSLWIPLPGPLGWQVDVEGYVSAPRPVSTGWATVGGGWIATGPSLDVRLGKDAVRLGLRGADGLAVVVGRGLHPNYENVGWHGAALADVGFAWRNGFRFLVRAEVPIVPLEFTYQDCPEDRPNCGVVASAGFEPYFRVGLAVAFVGRIGSSEGRSRDRP